MSIHKKIIAVAGFGLALLLPVQMVLAQVAPANPVPASSLAQRTEQRKAERHIVLEQRDITRLKSRCVAVQGNMREIQQKNGTMLPARIRVYQHIDAKLWALIGRLKLADRDTFELEKMRTTLAEKIANFQAIAANYQQALDDSIIISCQPDLVGFKAFVETTRIYHTQLRDQSADIRTYVIDQIKPAIAEHASELKPKTATEGEE